MIRLAFVVSMLLATLGAARAQTSPQVVPGPNAQRPAMRFEWVREGPADKCRDRCREWISARGLIVPDTARNFAEFTRERATHGATLVIESEGGSVSAAMALGRLIRRLGIAVTVGHTEKLIPGDGAERAELQTAAVCASMCPFVLLGGARRHIPPQARVMVHQVWPRQRREDAMAATYNAQDFVGLQRELGMLAKYVVEMGGDIELFEISMRIPPWESLRPLAREDLRRMKLINVEDPFSPGLTGTDPGASSAAILPVVRALNPAPDTGWAVSTEPGKRGISRKHPLTIEGEPIGSFELSFTCMEQGVLATYTEARQLREDTGNDRLALVSIVSGRDYGLRLAVRSSAPENGGDELRSTAQAVLPAAFVEVLTASDGRSLTVGTQTMRKVRTSIRPGNSGFAENFQRALAGCGKQ